MRKASSGRSCAVPPLHLVKACLTLPCRRHFQGAQLQLLAGGSECHSASVKRRRVDAGQQRSSGDGTSLCVECNFVENDCGMARCKLEASSQEQAQV